MDRRDFMKTLGATVGVVAMGRRAHATSRSGRNVRAALLVDTTRCAGCRSCEEACAEANALPAIDTDDDAMQSWRDTSESQFGVVNRYEVDDAEIFVRRQCMHCLEPACASACLTRAMYKTPQGPIIWREEKCMGCRYCMVSCPFDIPKFEYRSANPRILKCRMCWEKVAQGDQPACVSECPEEALSFGTRREMLKEAHRRIASSPDTYVDHIYGEYEAGGTSVLFLAGANFSLLGFSPRIDDSSYPELTVPFLYSVPVVLSLFPPLLLAMRRARSSEPSPNEDEEKP